MKVFFHILFFFPIWLSAQSVSHAVFAQFDENERGIWIRQYEGRMDDLSYVYLVLGYNDSEYRGIIQQKGVEDWIVEGQIDGSTLKLLVVDQKDNVKGYLEGIIRDSSINATFSDQKRAFQRALSLKRVLKNRSTEICSDNKWLKSYSGRLLNDDIKLVLQREEENVVYGLLFYHEQGVSYDLFGTCQDVACRQVLFEIKNPQDQLVGSIKFEEDDKGFCWLQTGSQISSPLTKSKDLPMVCGSRYFKGARLSYVYPYLEDKKVDEWMKAQANQWLSTFPNASELQKKDFRFWVDLDFIGEKLVSGTINMQTPGSINPRRRSFILPFGEDKPIELDDWIGQQSSFKAKLSEAIESEKSRQRSNEPESAQVWLMEQSFEHISIRKEGLCLKSDLSLVYGERKMIMPWSMVEPYLKRFVNLKKVLR